MTESPEAAPHTEDTGNSEGPPPPIEGFPRPNVSSGLDSEKEARLEQFVRQQEVAKQLREAHASGGRADSAEPEPGPAPVSATEAPNTPTLSLVTNAEPENMNEVPRGGWLRRTAGSLVHRFTSSIRSLGRFFGRKGHESEAPTEMHVPRSRTNEGTRPAEPTGIEETRSEPPREVPPLQNAA
jgi:hypothetical protein